MTGDAAFIGERGKQHGESTLVAAHHVSGR
jgi:hypothetical protein